LLDFLRETQIEMGDDYLERRLWMFLIPPGKFRKVILHMHYATNRQVAGSIPDVVIGIFQ
jgi:hypothetical protein